MQVGNHFSVHRMCKRNPTIKLWLDIKIGRWWYVLYWPRGHKVAFYRSLDATPPNGENRGKMLYGHVHDAY